MKREQLKTIGLNDDQIDKIMGLYGVAIEESKKSLSKLEELKTENESLKSQLSERDKDIKSMQKATKDNEDLQNQFKELQNKYTQDTQQLNNQLQQTRLHSALDNKLTSAKVRNPKTITGLLDMDKIKLNDNGELEGVDEQLKSLHKSDAYLFNDGTNEHYNPASGQPTDSNPAQALIDAFKD
ncbi:phage capsid protein [Bombilactobacillus bombi]|uniref:Phage capsid protein n=1 Tax=Bombilactobacillus bombi TaxID=1303590 RepID=A0A3R6V8Q9_9LACO|nr:phage scaffolding protein [Bombilactobacillus bombi]RHW49714.1 phage capsid protein [Bombilactobacillus bombi]